MAQHYESDITRFINEYKTKHPDTEKRQLEGRALLWDKQQDADTTVRNNASKVVQKPYPYDVNFFGE